MRQGQQKRRHIKRERQREVMEPRRPIPLPPMPAVPWKPLGQPQSRALQPAGSIRSGRSFPT